MKLTIKKRFKNIHIFFDWTYFKKIELTITGLKLKNLRYPFSFFNSKFIGELLPGWGRKKNKITIKKVLKFFNLEFIFHEITILRKHEYRKFLKRQGLL